LSGAKLNAPFEADSAARRLITYLINLITHSYLWSCLPSEVTKPYEPYKHGHGRHKSVWMFILQAAIPSVSPRFLGSRGVPLAV